jgi:predicted dehydrogenase
MKALFIGLGSIGQRHLRNLKSIAGNSIDLIAFRSKNRTPVLDEQQKVIENTNLEQQYGIREFDDLDQALADKPDIAFITNPSQYHINIALKTAEAGCHLFIEKPLSTNTNRINELLDLVHHKELTAMVAYQYRFHPGLIQVTQWLKNKKIGPLISATLVQGDYLPQWHPYEDYRESYASRKELGGGVLLTQIHEFDNALNLFGLPRRVFALGGKLSQLEVNVEDTASVLMECEHEGKVLPVTILTDFLQSPPVRTCNIIGENGRIFLDLIDNNISLTKREMEKTEYHDYKDFNRNQLFIDELKHFLDAVSGKIEPIVNIKTGLASLRMALAARKSIETGEPIGLL